MGHKVVDTSWMVEFSEWSILHHMLIVFLSVAAIMWILRLVAPLPERRTMPRSELDTRTPLDVWICGTIVIVITAGLYVWLA